MTLSLMFLYGADINAEMDRLQRMQDRLKRRHDAYGGPGGGGPGGAGPPEPFSMMHGPPPGMQHPFGDPYGMGGSPHDGRPPMGGPPMRYEMTFLQRNFMLRTRTGCL